MQMYLVADNVTAGGRNVVGYAKLALDVVCLRLSSSVLVLHKMLLSAAVIYKRYAGNSCRKCLHHQLS